MSLSSGSPGLALLWIPSRPAISIAENARYGLQLGSGKRTSIRRVLGLGPVIGMRTLAERFRLEYARLTGASKPGTRLRYEFVVGLVRAAIDLACLMMPPM